MNRFQITVKYKAALFMIAHNEQCIQMIHTFCQMPAEDRNQLIAYHQEQIDNYKDLLLLIEAYKILELL